MVAIPSPHSQLWRWEIEAYLKTLGSGGGGGGGSSIIVSDTPPPSPPDNQLWWESDTGILYIYYFDGNSRQWVQVAGPGANQSACYIGDTPPASPFVGELWFKSSSGDFYCYYDDGTSRQWVQINAYPGGGDIDLVGYSLKNVGSINGGPLGEFLNQTINGDFVWWQRATTQTATGYGSDDRWLNGNNGSTKTHSLQIHTLGQTVVPGNSGWFSRTVVTSVAGAANYCYKQQKFEDVRVFAGRQTTFTFYAKADAAKNIAVEGQQVFGTGGSPSATVSSIAVTTCALTTGWTRYDVLINWPSIAGMTLGSNVDHNSQILFWFDAGSNFNARTNSLGQQSGTFDISHVSMRFGDVRKEIDPFCPRHQQQELALCQRYCQKRTALLLGGYAGAGTFLYMDQVFPVVMRGTPSVTFANQGYGNASGLTNNATYTDHTRTAVTVTASGGATVSYDATYDAEL